MRFDTLPEIVSMNEIFFETVWALEFHQAECHELLHVVKGNFDLTFADGTKHHASSGDTLIHPQGGIHKDVFNPDDDLEIFIVHFQWDSMERYAESVPLKDMNSIDERLKADLKKIFQWMRFDCGDGEIDLRIANARLLTLLLMIYRGVAAKSAYAKERIFIDASKKRRMLLVDRAKRFLDKKYMEPLGLSDVADHLNVSPFHLSRIFSRESEFSVTEYLTDVRVNAAKELLNSGEYIIADVAAMVGYQDSNYFSKVFRKITGLSPSEFRRSLS